MCMHSMRKPAITSYLKWCQVRVNKMETWALSRYYTVYAPSRKLIQYSAVVTSHNYMFFKEYPIPISSVPISSTSATSESTGLTL